MNHYDLKDGGAHHWQDYPDQKGLLSQVEAWLWLQPPDVHIDSIVFGMDDDHRWYATAYCAGQLPDGKGN